MNKKKLGIIIILILIILLLGLTLITQKEQFVSNAINIFRKSDTTIENVETSTQGLVIHADELIKDSIIEADMKHNREYLQGLIDTVSNTGGGVVHMPSGTYNFISTGEHIRGNVSEYVIKCKDNVLLEGEGTDENTGTILKPYAPSNDLPVDMFYYNDYVDSNGSNNTFLKNADYRNFVIDGVNAYSSVVNSAGKGFMINLFENCDWYNVIVKNTDGTGFGVDCPINSTIKNCTAINCGKTANESSYGASGFGIGTGYSNDESILISNCTSTGNKKYGFFFEHQCRFNTSLYKADKAESLVVSNCTASGNLYNFGGAKANDVTYENCISYETDSRTVSGIYFEELTVRTNIINCEINKKFEDVADNSEYYYEPVYWAANNSITSGNTKTEFGPSDLCTNSQVVMLLWRMAGRPGEVIKCTLNEVSQKVTSEYVDVPNTATYVSATNWAKLNGISENNEKFYPDNPCTRAEFVKMLWNYANKPIVDTQHTFPDIEAGNDYEDAINWALNKGIITGEGNGNFNPNNTCTRGQIVTFLYRYSQAKNIFNINYNLNAGKFEKANPDSYKAGSDKFTLNNPIKTGYTFDGWTGSNYLEYVNSSKYIPQETVTISIEDRGNKAYTANWTANKYTISFDANGGTGEMKNEYFIYDFPQVLSENKFTRTGYIFKGWNTKQDGTGTTFSNKQIINNLTVTPDEEIKLYAQWEVYDANARTNIFIGDSGMVEMRNIIGDNGDEYCACRGMGIDWIKNTCIPQIEGKIGQNTNIIIGLGTNDLFNPDINGGIVDVDGVVEKYKQYFNPKAKEWTEKGAKVYFISIGPFDDNKIDSSTRLVNSADAIEFNNKIKTQLEGITYIDTYSSMIDDFNAKKPDLTREDGTHGTSLYYAKKYNIIKKALGQDYTPTFEAFNNMNDIPTNANYRVPLKWAYKNVFIDPISKTEFGGNNAISRAEALTLIWRSQGIPYYKSDLAFTDVNQNDLYYDAVMWGVGNKIVSGTADTTFEPNNICKRGHYIMFLWRIAGKTIVDTENNFTDIPSNKPYIDAINWAISERIIKEDLNGEFRPEEACTREEAITFLYNYYNKASNRKNIFVGASTYVEMHNIVGGDETWVAARGQGFDWVKNTALPSIESQIGEKTNVIIGICGNDLFNIYLNNGKVDVDGVVEMYAEYFNAKAVEYNQLGANVYFVSGGPVDDSKIDSTTRKINNADIVDFNNKIKTKLEGITFIDVYSEIIDEFNAKNPDLSRDDGSHGTALYYSKAYNIIKKALGQDYTPTYEAFNNMTDKPTESIPLKWAYENVFIDPISETEFGGNNAITRAEAICLVWRSEGIQYCNSNISFKDVDKESLYYDALMWGVGNNIVYGIKESQFAPDESCQRGDYITYLWRIAGKPIVEISNCFTDVASWESYIDAIKWAVSEGIIKEDINGKFRPKEPCTREEAIAFLYNYYNRYKITYNLDGGTFRTITPGAYVFGIDEFYLNVPIKKGYKFIGWTGSNGTEPQIEVAITRETIGDLEFVANWKELDANDDINEKIEHYNYVTNKWENKK